MAKKLRDYLMYGGVKGRKFVDPVYRPQETIYEVIGIEPMGIGGPRPTVSLIGKVVGTNEAYMKSLALCLKHEEYSQTSSKCSGPVSFLESIEKQQKDMIKQGKKRKYSDIKMNHPNHQEPQGQL